MLSLQTKKILMALSAILSIVFKSLPFLTSHSLILLSGYIAPKIKHKKIIHTFKSKSYILCIFSHTYKSNILRTYYFKSSSTAHVTDFMFDEILLQQSRNIQLLTSDCCSAILFHVHAYNISLVTRKRKYQRTARFGQRMVIGKEIAERIAIHLWQKGSCDLFGKNKQIHEKIVERSQWRSIDPLIYVIL